MHRVKIETLPFFHSHPLQRQSWETSSTSDGEFVFESRPIGAMLIHFDLYEHGSPLGNPFIWLRSIFYRAQTLESVVG